MPTTNKHPLQTIFENARVGKVRSYSGRAMYGESCLGVDVSRGDLGDLICALMEACLMAPSEGGDSYDALHKAAIATRGMRSDQMGMGMIYYFPNVPYVAGDEEDEDGEEEDD